MTDKAVSALTSLTGANTATGDLLYIVDISEAAAADRSKKITVGDIHVSIPNGTNSAPSIAFASDPNTGIFRAGADSLAFAVGGTQAVTLDASGNLLVGATSIRATGWTTNNSQYAMETTGYGGAQWFTNRADDEGSYIVLGKSRGTTVNSNTIVNSGDTLGALVFQGTNGTGVNSAAQIRCKVDGTPGASNDMPGRLEFYTTQDGSGTMTERARITSGGDLYINTQIAIDTAYKVQLYFASGGGISIKTGTDGDNAMGFRNSSGTSVGTIVINTAGTAYNTSSDYRLKDNQQPLTGSGAFIDALKPKTWDWKSGGKGVGFIAHEVAEVSPGTVVGEKDATEEQQYEVTPAVLATYDKDGNELTAAIPAVMGTRTVPKYQAMEYGSAEFIANIVAELQSLRARVASLEAK